MQRNYSLGQLVMVKNEGYIGAQVKTKLDNMTQKGKEYHTLSAVVKAGTDAMTLRQVR